MGIGVGAGAGLLNTRKRRMGEDRAPAPSRLLVLCPPVPVRRSRFSGDFHENLAQYKGQPVSSSRIELTMPPAMDDSAVTTTMVVSVARTWYSPDVSADVRI
jgi:hypothetical protein